MSAVSQARLIPIKQATQTFIAFPRGTSIERIRRYKITLKFITKEKGLDVIYNVLKPVLNTEN